MRDKFEYFRLTLKKPVPDAIILQGLEQWFRFGLISELSWRNLPSDRLIQLIILKNDQLFEGLTAWAELGILEPEQVENICENYLSSPIPVQVTTQEQPQITPKIDKKRKLATVLLPSKPPSSQFALMVQALFSEFSTLWLLFLGVFLTVVSSGLLAASQWQNFSAFGQYLILFTYTLGFLGVSFLTAKSDRLLLTTRSLQLVTLLLVPANFWAIDGLGLLSYPFGMFFAAIAGFILSGITVFLLQTSFDPSLKKWNLLTAIAILLLGWLHLGWGIANYPLFAVYVGVGAIATETFLKLNHRLDFADISTFPLAKIVSAYSTIVLVGRALLFGNVSITALGLAFGVCGWVLCQFADRQIEDAKLQNPQFQSRLGQVLLAIGWFVAVRDTYPWQATVVSLLIGWMICDRLRRLEKVNDLTILFFWGLQIVWLGIRLVPMEWWGGAEGYARIISFFQVDSLLPVVGVLAFPYLVLSLIIAERFRNRKRLALALRSEQLALGFGMLLTILSFAYPFTRFLNLSLSAIALGFVQARRPVTYQDCRFVIYATHIVGLGAIASGIFMVFPNLAFSVWIGISIAIALIEWSATWWLDLHSPQNLKVQIWRNSSWQLGLGLAAFSYYFLTMMDYPRLSTIEEFGKYVHLSWVIVPTALSCLGTRSSFAANKSAAQLSILGLCVWQSFIWQTEGARTLGLGIALVVMFANTRSLRTLTSAVVTTGFGLMFIGSTLWQIRTGGVVDQLTFGINGMNLSVILLFVLSHWLKYRRDREVINLNLEVNSAYAQAFDLWAVLLSTVTLSLQTFLAFSVFSDRSSFLFLNANLTQELFINLWISSCLITAGLIYRAWQQPVFWTEWGIAWGLELIVSGAIAITDGSVIELAIANLALGLGSQIFGDWYMRRTNQTTFPLSWDLIPLVYGVLGSLLRLGSFTNFSGLFTLGTCLVGIGISRRSEKNSLLKFLSYLLIAGATFSAYEILFYQLVNSKNEGNLGDGIVILGVLAAAIAILYQVCNRWIRSYLKFSSQEMNISAHLHWSASLVFLAVGSRFSPTPFGGVIAVGLAIILTIYALWQGRKSNISAEVWIYLGISTAIASTFYLFSFAIANPWLNQTILIPYMSAIASSVSVLFFLTPWQKLGWNVRPWHRAAFCLPLLFAAIFYQAIATPCLVIVAIFYGIRAYLTQNIRLSYLTVFFLDWAAFRLIFDYPFFPYFTYGSTICFSILYFTQVEPNLQKENRDIRHGLRSFASGGICLIAFLYSFGNIQIAAITWFLSLGFAIAGLALRVRAFLFIGTIAFIMLVLNQAVLLISQYAFLLWAIGIVAGIGFIAIAANFEVRRERILAIVRNIVHELDAWA